MTGPVTVSPQSNGRPCPGLGGLLTGDSEGGGPAMPLPGSALPHVNSA